MPFSDRAAIEFFHLVFLRALVGDTALEKASKLQLSTALEHALEIGYDQYAAQVVAFLDPTQRELFESRDAWDTMQRTVVTALEAAI